MRIDRLESPSSARICSGVRPAAIALELFLDHLLTPLGDLLEQHELLDLFAEQGDVGRVPLHQLSSIRI